MRPKVNIGDEIIVTWVDHAYVDKGYKDHDYGPIMMKTRGEVLRTDIPCTAHDGKETKFTYMELTSSGPETYGGPNFHVHTIVQETIHKVEIVKKAGKRK